MQGRRDHTLDGRYRLVRVLGRGGMGSVWEAVDDVLHRPVAVKEVVPPRDLREDQQRLVRARTLREARAAARISHPCVVTVYDVVEEDGRPWIVMQLLPAPTLADVIASTGPLPVERVAEIGQNLADALGAAHAAGVLHRDVKPGNVLLSDDGRAVLGDFGIATVDGDPSLTSTGMILGSPSYMAPERARGEPPTTASDVWSLGATLFAAVEGRSPFEREGQLSTLNAVISAEVPAASRAGRLAPLLSAMLAKDAGARPPITRVRDELTRIRSADAEAPATTLPLPATPPAPEPATAATRPAPPSGPPSAPAATTPPAALAATDPPAAPAATPPAAPAATIPPAAPATTIPPAAPATTDPPAAPATAAASGPPAPPEVRSAPPPPPRGPGRGRVVAGVAGAGLVLAAALAGGYVIANDRDPGGDRLAAEPGLSPRPSASATASGPSTSGPTPSATPSTPAPTPSPAAAVPAGFQLQRDPTGFVAAVPAGWTRRVDGTRVHFSEPGGRRFLMVDTTTQPKPDAAADWRQQEGAVAQRLGGYQRVRIEPVDYRGWNAADWEFTWQPGSGRLHVLNRGFVVSDRRAYALYWSVPEEQWAASRPLFDVVASSFQPAP